MNSRTRFYREVSVRSSSSSEGYSILLDGKPVKTPAGAALRLPNRALAEAVADEWRAQAEKIRPETMILTKLANTAIDRVRGNRSAVIEQILSFGRSDLVCYRADGPPELVERQTRAWDPLLDWASVHHGAAFKTTSGIGFIEQPKEAIEALNRAIAQHDDFALAGLHAGATLCGSALIALALSARHLGADEAFAAAHLDELYQAGKWGSDMAAQARLRARASDLASVEQFLRCLRG
jgi:chaperone required for assembly of F1-ATPase